MNVAKDGTIRFPKEVTLLALDLWLLRRLAGGFYSWRGFGQFLPAALVTWSKDESWLIATYLPSGRTHCTFYYNAKKIFLQLKD
jgi:hypothetical protein